MKGMKGRRKQTLFLVIVPMAAQPRFLSGQPIYIHMHIHSDSESRPSICVLFTLVSFLSLPVGLFFSSSHYIRRTSLQPATQLGDGGITPKKTFEMRCRTLY